MRFNELVQAAPEIVAPSLLGARLRSDLTGAVVTAMITEVEAYGGIGTDAASHAHRGPTRRNATMFDRAGLLYVYRSYGMHWCLNVVTGSEGEGCAVLLRAGEIVEGVEIARARRLTVSKDRDLARGPGRLAAALGITGSEDGLDLLDAAGAVQLLPGAGAQPWEIRRGVRVGISKETDRPWRWWWDGHPTVSRSR